MDLEIKVLNATVVDGCGTDRFVADVGVAKDSIVAVGNLKDHPARQVISASGLTLAPGFVDIHTHSDTTVLSYPDSECRLRQGVTTDVVGNCSYSPFPVTEATRSFFGPLLQDSLESQEWVWKDVEGYRSCLNRRGIGINIAPLVGHGSVRVAAMGLDDRPPSPAELDHMKRSVTDALEQGAFGFSTGLTLAPSSFSDTDELVEISSAAANKGGFYATHSRLWAGYHFRAVEEAIEIGRRAGIPIQVSHQTIVDPRYYGQASQIVEMMEKALEEGIDVRYDVYPYVAGGTQLDQLLPDWALEGGRHALLSRIRDPQTRARIRHDAKPGWFRGIPWQWDRIFLAYVKTEEFAEWMGKSLATLADALHLDPLDAMLHLIDTQDNVVGVVIFNRDEDDVRYFLAHPLSIFGSDGSALSPRGLALQSRPHPRYYGTFPRILGRYCRELKLLTLEDAIRKMTFEPAKRLGLTDRGRIAVGCKADITLFDADRISDRASLENPHQFPDGIEYVLVNGEVAVTPDGCTGALAGVALSRTN